VVAKTSESVGPTIRGILASTRTAKYCNVKGFWNDILISQDVLGDVCDFVCLGLCLCTVILQELQLARAELEGPKKCKARLIRYSRACFHFVCPVSFRLGISNQSLRVSSLLISNHFEIR
jgi:hypothetical protein